MNWYRDILECLNSLDNISLIESYSGFNILEIKNFRTDGKTTYPCGIASSFILKDINENKKSFIKSKVYESFLNEDIPFWGVPLFKGGMIVFSTDINVSDDKDKSIGSKISRKIRNMFSTYKNRLFRDKKLNDLFLKFNQEYKNISEDDLIGGFTIGNNFRGRYKSPNGGLYNEKSFTIDMVGVPSEVLLLFAIEVSKEFGQESVLVQDREKNKIYFATKDDISGENPQERIDNAKKEIEIKLSDKMKQADVSQEKTKQSDDSNIIQMKK